MNPPRAEWCVFIAEEKKKGKNHITIPIDVAEEVFNVKEEKPEPPMLHYPA